MGYLRFFRRKKLGPGLTLNLSKSGPSLSMGPRGAKVTVGRRGIRRTVGIHGTGISYTSTTRSSATAGGSVLGGLVALVILLALAGSCLNGPAGPGVTPTPPAPLNYGGGTEASSTPGDGTTIASPATKTPSPKATHKPKPTPRPTPRPKPKPTTAPGVNGNPWGYDFRPGNLIYNPPADFCSYFTCIGNFGNSPGYVIECTDGEFSTAGGRQGACSHHQGVWRPLYSH